MRKDGKAEIMNKSQTTKNKMSTKEAATLAVAICRTEPIWKAEKEIEKLILTVLEGHKNG